MSKKRIQRKSQPRDNPRALPQVKNEVWQAALCRFPAWVGSGRKRHRPWLMLITNRSEDLVLAQALLEQRPKDEIIWDTVVDAICAPLAGIPHRPGEIQVRSADLCAALQQRLGESEILCTVCEQLDQLDFVLQELARHLSGDHGPPTLVDSPGMRPQQIAGCFEAAAEFYRRKPWTDVPSDTPVEVRCAKFKSGPWYAVVMGQSRMTYGLAMHEDARELARLIESNDPRPKHYSSAITLLYGKDYEISVRDLDAAEAHGWAIAGPSAYPLVLHVNPGGSVRAPLVWELELLEASLRALPEFFSRGTKTAAITVEVGSEQIELDLSFGWPGAR